MSQLKVVPGEVQQKTAKFPKQPQPLLLIQLDLGGQQTGEDLVLQMMDIQGYMNYIISLKFVSLPDTSCALMVFKVQS